MPPMHGKPGSLEGNGSFFKTHMHKAFAGSKVWALHAFQRSTPKIARVASRGTLLVDTGACCSVCTPEAFQTADLDPSATEELYTVD